MSQRTDRVDELLREEIGTILTRELADPRIGFVTITDIETSPDLRHAKVWVSIIGDRVDRTESVRALQASMGFVRHELGKRLRIKRIPDLHIRLDDSMERGTRVLHLLNNLQAGADPEAIPPIPETLPRPTTRLPHEGDLPEEPESAAAPAMQGRKRRKPFTGDGPRLGGGARPGGSRGGAPRGKGDRPQRPGGKR